MIPRIIELEDGRPKVTAEAYGIPEIKSILDKYDMKAEPYLAYIQGMTWPESPYINMEDEEKKEVAIYDTIQTYGDFDIDDPLLEPAIQKLTTLYYSPLSLVVNQLNQELHKLIKYLKHSEITDDNLKDRAGVLKDIERIASSYGKVKEQADKEMQVKMRGKAELGDY